MVSFAQREDNTKISLIVDFPPPKTVVIGCLGFMGSELFRQYKRYYPDTLGTDYKGQNSLTILDLSEPRIEGLRLRESGFQHAIIAAAIPGVLCCETEKEFTRRCNVEGTLELARQLYEEGLKPIFFSSDYVFDGRSGAYCDDSPTNPLNEYGLQKAEVEERLSQLCHGNFLVIRLAKVFGIHRGDRTILDEMAAHLAQGKAIRAASDQLFCPTLIDDAIRAILLLQRAEATGIFNVCTPEVWSRYNLATRVADALEAKQQLVQKISLDDLGEIFQRPKRTDMLCKRLAQVIEISFTPVSACIDHLAKQYTYEHN